MSILIAIALVLSLLQSFSTDYKYPGAIIFSVTLICATALLITDSL